MIILGVTFGHKAAACLIVDGAIIADAAEERFSRIKHDSGFRRQPSPFA
jgi:carbamoyltransferase